MNRFTCIVVVLTLFVFAGCQSQTKDGPTPKSTNGPSEAVTADDPMSAAEAWCAQQTPPAKVLRLLKVADTTYAAVAAAEDKPEATATRLTIVYESVWTITKAEPTTGDEFWPSL